MKPNFFGNDLLLENDIAIRESNYMITKKGKNDKNLISKRVYDFFDNK